MNKQHKGGFTLIEMLVTILIMAIMVVATTTGMETALRVYKEATFQSNSASLESMLRSMLEDLLSYAENVKARPAASNAESDFLFTNQDYNEGDVYLLLNTAKLGGSPVQMVKADGKTRDLLNTGAYPSLTIQPPGDKSWMHYDSTNKRFEYDFTIVSQQDPALTRTVKGSICLLNPEKTTEPT